jgi:predicted RND superfamily exporter protein
MDARTGLAGRVGGLLEKRSGWFLLAMAATTLLLAVPMFTMAPDHTASDNPGGRVYDLQALVNANLPPRVHGVFFLAEATNGDMLTQAPLWELYRNTQALKDADRNGQLNPPGLEEQQYLYNGFDTDRQQPIFGIFTLANAVQEALALHPLLNTDLEHATDEQVKVAVHFVLNDPRTEILENMLSNELKASERRTVLGQEIDYWTSPALLFPVTADNEKLGGGGIAIGVGGNDTTLNKEAFNRKVQAQLRGDEESYQMWGVAIDAGLEIEDELATAIPFIIATFIMVLIVVGISLRSARVVLLTGLGLAFMIVWLKGLSNLVGLNSSTTLDFIVPIAMISLGADFAIHAVSRYREERSLGLDARRALRVGMRGVLAALVLAMATDAIAFLSNASADIETVVGFGIGAGFAILAAFMILGLALPVALMRWDVRREQAASPSTDTASPPPVVDGERRPSRIADLMVRAARVRYSLLPVVAVVTAVAGYYAFQLEGSFDVKDFFKSDSDFVVGLDKLDLHLGESGGEPAIIYIEGDLTAPSALATINRFLDKSAENPTVGKNDEGEATIQARPIFVVLDQVLKSDYARAQIEAASGVPIPAVGPAIELEYAGRTYRAPDSKEQLKAIYDYVVVNGVPLSPTQRVYDALEVGETLYHDPTGVRSDATAIYLGVPGTREQTNVIASRDAIIEDLRLLEADPSITEVGLTGSPYIRQASLDATTDGLQRALPIAVMACLVIAVAAMRSIRFGVVTIIPIGLVVAWLYALMYAFGFGLNFVTATIAAVSIGVGIDYAIHMTQRFREELGRADDRFQALRQAGSGTGVALVASAVTSILGFAIMGFAPMPLFSSYGILTALMIFLAAAGSLLVLPSLLILVTPRKGSST